MSQPCTICGHPNSNGLCGRQKCQDAYFTRRAEANPMPERKPLCKIYMVECNFNPHGEPAVIPAGEDVRRVVIIDGQNWVKLLTAIPALAEAKFEVGNTI